MVGEPDKSSSVFGIESLADAEAKARQVLRDKGFTEDQIEAQLAKTKRDYRDWPPPQPDASAHDTGKRE